MTLATGGSWEQALWNANFAAATAGYGKAAGQYMSGTQTVNAGGTWVEAQQSSLYTTAGGETMMAMGDELGAMAVTLPENNLATYWSIAKQAPEQALKDIMGQAKSSWTKVKDLVKTPWEDLVKMGVDGLGDFTKESWEALKQLPSDAWEGFSKIPSRTWAFMKSFDLPMYLMQDLPAILSNMRLYLAGASGGDALGAMGTTLGIMGAGGLSNGLYIGGERGREWAVPTYEPEHSRFLRDVGADPERIGEAVARRLEGRDGGTVHVHLNLDGREIGSAIIKNGEVIEQIDYSLSKLWKRHYA